MFMSNVAGRLARLLELWLTWKCFIRITHEELQCNVVDEDVFQWDNTELAKVSC